MFGQRRKVLRFSPFPFPSSPEEKFEVHGNGTFLSSGIFGNNCVNSWWKWNWIHWRYVEICYLSASGLDSWNINVYLSINVRKNAGNDLSLKRMVNRDMQLFKGFECWYSVFVLIKILQVKFSQLKSDIIIYKYFAITDVFPLRSISSFV